MPSPTPLKPWFSNPPPAHEPATASSGDIERSTLVVLDTVAVRARTCRIRGMLLAADRPEEYSARQGDW
jgi:hypothetical protein